MNGFFPSSLVHKEKPLGLIPKCGSCKLFQDCNSPKMKVYGEGRRRVLIVGEFPGETEDHKGKPFTGKGGRFLRDTLETLGIDMVEDTWMTNALICHPPNNKIPDPGKMVRYCHPNLLRTVEACQPRVVVTLGQVALRSVLLNKWDDVEALDRWTGNRIPLAEHWVCPTFHPNYLLREESSYLNRMFHQHLESAFAIDRDPKPLKLPEFELLTDEAEAQRAIRWFDKMGGWLAYDYEGTCIKPEWPRGELLSCSMSNGDRTIAYPWTEGTKQATGKTLHSDRTRKIASNLKMEERWTLREFSKGTVNWGWDTMLAAHALDNRSSVCSLKYQCFVRLGVPVYNKHIEPFLRSENGPYNRIKEIDRRQLLYYNAMDSFLEYKLAMKQRKDFGYGPKD